MQYHELVEVSGLPPDKMYDYAVDLLPGTSSPLDCIYPLSLTKQHAIQEYIQETVQQVCICPFTSPASARFVFMEKIGEQFRPFIDYNGLNQVNVK